MGRTRMAVLGLLLLAGAAPGCGAASRPLSAPLSAEEGEILQLTNEARSLAGLEPLSAEPPLCMLARDHARQMAVQGQAKRPEGTAFGKALEASGYPSQAWVVTVHKARSAESPRETFDSLMKSIRARSEVFGEAYIDVGVGLTTSANSEYRFLTLVFARKKDQ